MTATIVLAGDAVPIPTDSPLRLGPGLLHDHTTIIATKSGLLHHTPPNAYFINNHQRKYVPATNDSVVGVVSAKLGDGYRVDVGSAHSANLPFMAFEGATKRNRPNLNVGSLVFARVELANKDMDAELSCVNPATQKSDGFGELKGDGYVLRTSLLFARRLLHPSSPLLVAIGKKCPFEITIGHNGRVWVKSGDVMKTMLIVRCLSEADGVPDDQLHSLVASHFE